MLVPCTEDSAASVVACEAGRGVHPRVVVPAIVPDLPVFPPSSGAGMLQRAAVILGHSEGRTTEDCLRQLVLGPRLDLRGCAIGVTDLVYGPGWALESMLDELGFPSDGSQTELPLPVLELLPPNTAPRIEEVRVELREHFVLGQPNTQLEARSIHEPIEVEAGMVAVFEPVVPLRDQQLEISWIGPDSWVGQPERFHYDLWADAPISRSVYGNAVQWTEQFPVYVPEVEGTVHVYVLVTDGGYALSWFALELEVVAR